MNQGIIEMKKQALQNIAEAHNTIIEVRVFQTHTANSQYAAEPKLMQGDLVFLFTQNLNLPKGRARKLCPKFVGPCKILQARPKCSTYTLELPMALQTRRIVPSFHVLLLQPYHATNDAMFPDRVHPEPYNFSAPDDQEWFDKELKGHQWINGKNLKFEVRWSLGNMTWEPLSACRNLEMLDQYLELKGIQQPAQLAKC